MSYLDLKPEKVLVCFVAVVLFSISCYNNQPRWMDSLEKERLHLMAAIATTTIKRLWWYLSMLINWRPFVKDQQRFHFTTLECYIQIVPKLWVQNLTTLIHYSLCYEPWETMSVQVLMCQHHYLVVVFHRWTLASKDSSRNLRPMSVINMPSLILSHLFNIPRNFRLRIRLNSPQMIIWAEFYEALSTK